MDPWEFRPPVLVGERVVWLGSGSGIPQGGVVRWIGKLPEMGPDWTVGMELDNQLPYGGIDGTWGNRHLFSCRPKHGLIVPITSTLRERDLFRRASHPGTSVQHGSTNFSERPERPKRSEQPRQLKSPKHTETPKRDEELKHTQLPKQSNQSPYPEQPKQTQLPQQLLKTQLPDQTNDSKLPEERVECQLPHQLKETELPDHKTETKHPEKQKETESSEQLRRNELIEQLKTIAHQQRTQILQEELLDELPSVDPPLNDAVGERLTSNPLPALRRKRKTYPQRPTRLKPLGRYQVNGCDCVTLPCPTIKEECELSTPSRCGTLPSTVASNSGDTLKSIVSGDYKWYDAVDKADSTVEVCTVYEPVEVTSDVVDASQRRECSEEEVTNHDRVQSEIMNNRSNIDFSYEETVTVTDEIYADKCNTNSYQRSTSSSCQSQTGSGSRKEKANSGFFSFLRWFRKGKDDDDDVVKNGAFVEGGVTPTAPSSPQLVRNRSHNSSCGSIDSLFSTATVSSFSFVQPTYYRPYGSANPPEKCIAGGPDTDTYRNRLRYRDRARELDKNLTLKKKYRLYASDSLSAINTPEASPQLRPKRLERVQSEPVEKEQNKLIPPPSPGSQNSTFGKKKRRAPVPPNLPKAQYNDYSLPSTLENKSKVKSEIANNGSTVSLNKTYHRRTASESSKDKKAGAYCHVKGKRKAPSPPRPGVGQGASNSGTLEKVRSASSSFGRKKRPAPLPPQLNGKEELSRRKVNKESQVEQLQKTGNKTTLSNLSPAERDKLMANIAKLQAHADRRSIGSPPPSPHLAFRSSHIEQVVSNDTLKIERGVLKSNKEMPKIDPPIVEVKVAPCSPRPWYKRSLVKSDSGSSIVGGGLFKSLEKKKERDKDKDKEEVWMPEVGIARSSLVISESSSTSSSKFNIFSRLDKSEEKKKEAEKRKSQVSMLANISELDREAAEIVQKSQARENAIIEAHDAKFYAYPDTPSDVGREEDIDEVDGAEVPKRSSARELISLFNAIGNVTRVTVNTSFFSKDGASFFSKEGIEKRFSFMGDSSKSTVGQSAASEARASDGHKSPTVSSPSVARRVDSMTAGITPEEMDDEVDRASKARILYESNKSRRHRSPSPSFPTIAEQSESASSVATPLSTQARVVYETSPALEADNQVWVCPRCTLENPRWKITCDVCNRWRPSSTGDRTSITEDPVERPASPVPFMDQDKDEARSNGIQLNETKKVLNWEDELKRYFPDSPKITRGKTEIKTQTTVNNIEIKKKNVTQTTSNASPAIIPPVVPTETKTTTNELQEKNEAIFVRKSVVDSPSTFIGGKLKQDEDKVSKIAVNKQTVSNGVVGSDLPTIEETDVDELRKARLAFFNRSCDKSINITEECKLGMLDANPSKKVIDENERSKLREMLKEMKNSLPKRPKVNGSQASCDDDNRKSINLDQHDVYKQIENSAVCFQRNSIIKDDSNKQGAIKKIPQIAKEAPIEITPVQNNAQTSMPTNQNGKCEALFITKTTIYENIKMKKTDPKKPQKVSTSVQTSGVIRKIESSEMKPPTGRPATTEAIKDGVLYTSLNKDSLRIGKGTFELIRATDFKNIEATKTDCESAPLHVYANMPTSPNLSKRVLTQQPSAPTREEVFNEPGEDKLDDDLPVSLQGSSDQWSSATESPVPRFPESPIPQSPESRSARGGSKRSTGSDVSGYSGVSCRSSDTSEVERLTEELTKPKGLADFKACLQAAPGEQNNMNTLAVNRLLRRLEAAIAGGQHIQAAGLARDLARQKISCSVTRQRRSLDSSPAAIMVDMYVEDKVSHQGPIPLQVMPTMTVAQLKQKVEQEFEIPAGVQRWILGKLLAADDAKTLEDHNVNASGCPMFLYLVVPDGEQESDAGSARGSIVEKEQTQPEEEFRGPPLPAPPGKGWYYNYEEDHYSHCEDSDEDLSDGEVEALRVSSPIRDPLPPAAKVAPPIQDEEEEDDDEEDDDEEEAEDPGVAGNVVLVKEPTVVIQDVPKIPRLPEVYSPVAGSSRAIAVRAAQPLTAVEAITKTLLAKVENKTGTLKLGWKCPVCTLVNAPTRPGCAACTTERPAKYIVPADYRANHQEMQRLEREQQLDNDMQQATAEEKRQEVADQHQHYLQLVNLDKADLVPNSEPFDCSVCLATYGPGEGTVLRECLHIFCRPCLLNTVQFSEEAEVKCPYRDVNYACDSVLQEREIKALVPKNVYEQHLAKSVAQAENKIGNAFHCKTPDCRGWCIFEDNLNEFRCPVCVRTNCLTCQAIHDGINCKQYQEQVKQESETNIEARRTKDMLEDMVYRGEAMKCPTCQVILMKKWGCDWLRCSMCKTEICWVTRGPRWGPGGKGDTTGGCQCGLNGIKCHPRCNYCH